MRGHQFSRFLLGFRVLLIGIALCGSFGGVEAEARLGTDVPSSDIKGVVIRDDAGGTTRYRNDALACSFAVPLSWTLMLHEYAPGTKALSIGFARYDLMQSILHGGENEFVSLAVFVDAMDRWSITSLMDKYYGQYSQEFSRHEIRWLGEHAGMVAGEAAVVKARVVGTDNKSKRTVDHWFAGRNNIYLLTVDMAPGREEDGFALTEALEQVVSTFEIW